MYLVGDFYRAMDAFAPFSTAEKWDNVGLLIGSPAQAVAHALLALDLTSAVLEEARRLHANLVITHHPVIMDKLSAIAAESLVYRAIAGGIAVISAHTNLDLADGGVNDALAARLALHQIQPLHPASDRSVPSLGRIGSIAPLSAQALAAHVKETLGAAGLRFVDGGSAITRVAVCGGSCGNMLSAAGQAGADALVTGDVKHHQLLEGLERGITIIDAGHYATEQVILAPLCAYLLNTLPQAQISVCSSGTDGAQYL